MWEPVAQLEFEPEAPGRKSYLPSGRAGCRFCVEATATLTFEKDAHAFPAALGNRYVLTREECDDCNELGGDLESDLAAHLTVTRVMSRIRGRSGDVKHRFGNRPSSIAADAVNNRLVVVNDISDDSLSARRTRDGVAYRIKVPAYRPLNVVRALARMALMLVPATDLDGLDHIRGFIRGEVHWPSPRFDEGFVPGPGLRMVRVGVDKNLDLRPAAPIFRVGLSFGTAILVLHMPARDMMLADIPLPPRGLRSPYAPHDVQWRRVSVLRDEVARGRIDEVSIFVPALAGLPPPTHHEIAVGAYYRWLSRRDTGGRGSTLDDWLEAEDQLRWHQVPSDVVPASETATD